MYRSRRTLRSWASPSPSGFLIAVTVSDACAGSGKSSRPIAAAAARDASARACVRASRASRPSSFRILERLPEGQEEGHRGGPRGIVVLEGLEMRGQVQIEGRGPELRDRPVGQMDEREPGGGRETLLAARDEPVDLPGVDGARDTRHGGDAVDEEQRSRPVHVGRQGGEIVGEADARLVMHDADRSDVPLLQLGPGGLEGDVRSPGSGEGRDPVAVPPGRSRSYRSPKFPFVSTRVRSSFRRREE